MKQRKQLLRAFMQMKQMWWKFGCQRAKCLLTGIASANYLDKITAEVAATVAEGPIIELTQTDSCLQKCTTTDRAMASAHYHDNDNL